eukprot:m.85425 g.85425  ORF g.85425 m.85425 type:complete len:123 (+) comp17878_c0_seq1:50-418(+)
MRHMQHKWRGWSPINIISIININVTSSQRHFAVAQKHASVVGADHVDSHDVRSDRFMQRARAYSTFSVVSALIVGTVVVAAPGSRGLEDDVEYLLLVKLLSTVVLGLNTFSLTTTVFHQHDL